MYIMRKTLKKYFIPHKENNYHPHILHPKRVAFYGGAFVAMKIIVVAFALFLPLEVFLMPDVLAEEQKQIIALVNETRNKNGLPNLGEIDLLDRSSDDKATDMAVNQYFSHTGPNNHGLRYFLNNVGYQYQSAGENLAMGFSSAHDVVEAWIKSPTHYANLLDSEYQETGVGLESGYFNGVPTVYVAQHFGWPASRQGGPNTKATIVKSVDPVPPQPKNVATTATNKPIEKKVAAVTIETSKPAPVYVPVVYDKTNSKVYWQENDGTIAVSVKALITGSVESATVSIGEVTIMLRKEADAYVGEATINQSVDEFFKVIISPVIGIKSTTGEFLSDTIDWNTIKIVSPTPTAKYLNAKQSLGFLTNIFAISKDIYLIFIILFSVALLLGILIEIKIQYPKMIAQTVGLISLLLCLYII